MVTSLWSHFWPTLWVFMSLLFVLTGVVVDAVLLDPVDPVTQ